jgi:KDO2-lipid IV(A) lauroyltransferase
MLLLFQFFARFPLGVLHGLGLAMGWIVFALSPTYRRRFLDNSRQAGYGFSELRAAVGHAGKMAAELPRLWFGRPVPMNWRGENAIEQAIAAKRGIVLLTPHMGCFELAAQAIAERFGERMGGFTVMFRPARQAGFAALMGSARRRPGLSLAPASLAGVRSMLRALKAGQAVGLLPDQVPPQGMGQWTSFFGRDAYTMVLGAKLALQSDATVLLVWVERLAHAQGFVLHVRDLDHPLSPTLETAVQEINQAMESLIRQSPTQYLWGYGRYKQPRENL